MKVAKVVVLLLIIVSLLSAYIKTTTMAEMRDGINLATDYYLPQGHGEGPWPAVVVRTTYNKNDTDPEFVDLLVDENGYALVVQDARGRFASEGIDSVFLDDAWGEAKRDGYDCIEWTAEQSWCDGNIGTWGASALGITQYLTAGAAPPSLKCQFVMVGVPSLYHYVTFPGGEFRKRDIETWLWAQGSTHMLTMFEEHPSYDETWARVNLDERWDSVDVPCYHVAGWYDLFLDGGLHSFTNYQFNAGDGARGNQKLVVGPWTHGTLGARNPGDLIYPENAEFDLTQATLDWFNHWLKGENNGIMDGPPVSYYQMGDPANGVTDVENLWMVADTWPLQSDTMRYYLYKSGSLDSVQPVIESSYREFSYDPETPVTTVGGRNLVLASGPKDQGGVEAHPQMLNFTTGILDEPVVVAGKITAHLWAAANRTDTDWSVRISDVYPDGRSMLVGDGILRARFHESAPLFDSEDLLTPDSIYLFEVDLWSSAITFAAGHRIRVSVTSSNSPRFEVNPNTGAPFRRNDPSTQIAHNRIYCDASHPSTVLLPIPSEKQEVVAEAPLTILLDKPVIFDGEVYLSIPVSGIVSLDLYDVMGRKVESLLQGNLTSGDHTVALPALPNGVYFVRLNLDGVSTTARFIELY